MENLIEKAESLLQALKDRGELDQYPEAFELFMAVMLAKLGNKE